MSYTGYMWVVGEGECVLFFVAKSAAAYWYSACVVCRRIGFDPQARQV